MPHIPDLEAMHRLEDQEIRICALIGAIVTLASSLEGMFFSIFEKATQINNVSEVFYAVENGTARLNMANAAMRGKLSGSPLCDEWQKLHCRILSVTKRAAQRNVVAHGEMSYGVTVYPGAAHLVIRASEPPVPAREVEQKLSGRPTEHHFFIRRDQPQLMKVSKSGPDADAESLFSEAKNIAAVIADLSAFLTRLP